jgi:hypothetical protein
VPRKARRSVRVFAPDSCGTVIDLDLTVKRRDSNAPIRIALDDVRCPRCNGYGRRARIGPYRNEFFFPIFLNWLLSAMYQPAFFCKKTALVRARVVQL